MTSSLKVAEVFGKLHFNVLNDIRKLVERGVLNFQESSYVNSQNKQQPMFLMDRKGFVLLAMGFTGDTALQFKSKYIDEFYRMEAELRGKIKADPVVNSVVVAMTTTTRGGISEQRCRRNFYGPRP